MLGLVAWAGSANLDKVVSLVGCFACIPLSFIYPALFHTHITENKWVRMKDWFIVVFGKTTLLTARHNGHALHYQCYYYAMGQWWGRYSA